MKTLIVGCGSIGSRRARLLAEMGHKVTVMDAEMYRAAALIYEVPGIIASSLGNVDVLANADATFVCTPAHTHLAISRESLNAGRKALFIEKPLSTSMDGVAELVAECERRGVVTMGACNMRWAYRDVQRAYWVKEAALCVAKPLSSWRAGASDAYRPSGLMLECAIHELDLAYHFCGPIVGVNPVGDDDAVIIGVEHARGGHSQVYASWAEDEPERRWVALNGEVARHEPDTSDDMYRQEMAHFLDCVASGTATCNPIANAAETLRWALHARDLTRMQLAP